MNGKNDDKNESESERKMKILKNITRIKHIE
jgi:hypothetical protein